MSHLINAKGLGRAEPVALVKNSLDVHDEIILVTDDPRVLENLAFLCMHEGYSGMRVGSLVDVTGEPDEIYWIRIRKTGAPGEKPRVGPARLAKNRREE